MLTCDLDPTNDLKVGVSVDCDIIHSWLCDNGDNYGWQWGLWLMLTWSNSQDLMFSTVLVSSYFIKIECQACEGICILPG